MFNFFKSKKPSDQPPDSSAVATKSSSVEIKPELAVAAAATWRERLGKSAISRSLGTLFSSNPKLDEDLLDELETVLLSADVGVTATEGFMQTLRSGIKHRDYADANALLNALRADMRAALLPVQKPLRINEDIQPFVILVVGVNGVGKTTSIGKLAQHLKSAGAQVMLAAGDTFRAAAVEQLQAWGERNDVTVIAQGSGADSASVIYDAVQAAKTQKVDVLIADTAGRLHTQSGLMDELQKVHRVIGKIDDGAPHEVLLVLDGTTGQNALNQARQFHAAVKVSGLIVTKLDGSAKGGVVFALAKELGIPIRFVGVGEGLHDLRSFDAAAFVDGILPNTLVTPTPT